MNLQEFINLRDKCPFCDHILTTQFISDRKQKTKIDNNRFIAILIMRGMRSCEPDDEVGYSFGLTDTSLTIEFYNEWDMKNYVTNHMIKIFKLFHQNMSNTKFLFIRACRFCFKYEMYSKIIDINLKKSQYSSIEICNESFMFTSITDDGYKFILLDNHIGYDNPSSQLCWWRSSVDYKISDSIPHDCSEENSLPLIAFLSKNETAERLNNLIIFA